MFLGLMKFVKMVVHISRHKTPTSHNNLPCSSKYHICCSNKNTYTKWSSSFFNINKVWGVLTLIGGRCYQVDDWAMLVSLRHHVRVSSYSLLNTKWYISIVEISFLLICTCVSFFREVYLSQIIYLSEMFHG